MNKESNKGVLKLRIKEGESIFVGDSEVIVDYISDSGRSVSLVVIADKSIRIDRSKLRKENDSSWNK